MTKERTLDDLLWSDAFWLWARVAFIALCVIVGTALCLSCSPPREASTVREASVRELSSVVTLEAQVGLGYVPYCNAFALRSEAPPRARDGSVRLVTAAHCLARVRLALGGVARYREPAGWGVGSARVTRLERARDYAELVTEDAHGLVPLELGLPPHEGAYLSTPSALFGESVAGRVYALGGQRVAFYGEVARGWSGSPVLDVHGRAVGVVTRCVLRAGQSSACADGVIAGLL